MMELFDNMGSSNAVFSKCHQYRYALWRIWDERKPKVMFVGLNPSTANEKHNDPTIKSVIRIARHNGFGGFYMMNLFAIISPKPEILKTAENPVGPKNDMYIHYIAEKCDRIVFAWGKFDVYGRDEVLMKKFPQAYCLGHNSDFSPKHPLFIKGSTDLVPFPPALIPAAGLLDQNGNPVKLGE